ncbi:putative leader peptide [Nonomuraea guangzhouensis]|uniref:Leader peptide n=1 Tax=Nonomuraea guangzhouensis TaxID=1291555 RepID=A0ABW4GW33_9ACTN
MHPLGQLLAANRACARALVVHAQGVLSVSSRSADGRARACRSAAPGPAPACRLPRPPHHRPPRSRPSPPAFRPLFPIGKVLICEGDHSYSRNDAPFVRLRQLVRFSVLSVWLVERLHIDLCRLTGSICR